MMEFDWTPRPIGEWRKYLELSPRANWMQTWPYAQACLKRDYQFTRIALIKKDDIPVGLFCARQLQLGPIHFINITRGPIWFFNHSNTSLFIEFAEKLNKTFPKRPLRRRRWLPEWEYSETMVNKLSEIGFKLMPQTYETIWIDLNKSTEELRSNLEQKWRNCLNKAEKSELEIEYDTCGKRLALFLNRYHQHKLSKKFIGPSVEFLKEEFLAGLPPKDYWLTFAKKNNSEVAGIMIAIHGQTASYRVAWNSEEGRSSNAHYLMLWDIIQKLKQKEIKYFDLGGILPKEEPELTHFKRGLNGHEIKLIGFLK